MSSDRPAETIEFSRLTLPGRKRVGGQLRTELAGAAEADVDAVCFRWPAKRKRFVGLEHYADKLISLH